MGLIVDASGEPFEAESREQTLSPEQLEQLLRRQVEENRGAKRTSLSQKQLDRTAEACLAEGEIALGHCVMIIHAARLAGIQNMVLEVLWDLMEQIKTTTTLLNPACRVCGCTNDRACEGGCEWVEFDLCSRCAAEAHVV